MIDSKKKIEIEIRNFLLWYDRWKSLNIANSKNNETLKSRIFE